MGRIASAFSLTLGHRLSPENPNIKLAELQQFLSDIGGGGTSDSGTPVTQRNSVRLAAVWRCVRVLSGDVAALPLFVLERQQPRGRRRASEHPLHRLLHLQPNPWHSSYTFRGVLMANALLQGNGYAAIRRDRGGRIRELWPIPAARVEPKVRQDGSLFYEIRLGAGAPESWENSEILHVPGLGFDGVQGMSVLSAAREAIGTGLSLQKYGATLFRRGGRIPGVIQTPHTKLDDETRKNVRAGWDASVGGPDNWLTPAVFPKGWEWKEIGIKPNDGQWLESKKFSVLEICRFFGVNPHRVYDFDRATFTNFEHSSLSHTVDDLTPWLVNFEQEMNRKLLTEAEQERFFVEFSLQGRMRGDTQTRGQFYALLRQWGAASANDIREFENMPDLGPKGDVYLTPINMENSEVVAGVVRAVFHALEARGLAAPRPAPALPPARAALPPAELRAKGLKLRRKIRASQRPIIEDRASTIVRREIGAIEKELKQFQDGRSRRAVASLRKAIDDFYSTHGAWATSRMEPVLQSYAGLIDGAVAQELGNDPSEDMPAELERFTADYSQSFGKREASEGRLQLLAVIDEAEAEGDEEVVAALQQRLDEWGDKRAGKIGLNESVQFMAAAAKTLYVVAGVQAVRWVANAGACPFCQSLDGRTSSTSENFVNAGQGVDGGEGTDGPLRPSDNIGHPPLHGNCLPGDVMVSAEGITATSERWYDGDLFVLRTANGKQLACTPNHPVLTDSGWVPAETLDVGDHVVSCRAAQRHTSVIRHHQEVPARIEQVARAFGQSSEMLPVPVPGSAEAFHGDGRAGEITIVRTDRLLLREGQATLAQQGGKGLLSLRDIAASRLARQGRSTALLEAAPATPRGAMGGHVDGCPVTRRAVPPDEELRRGRASDGNPGLEQTLSNGPTIDAERLGKGELALAGDVFLDKVIHVERYPFHGKVFNLHTAGGWYFAAGIVTHNCECDLVAD